ncbi:carboxypeptidase-like regulatory domain-containing protein [Vitellibacter sp. q18]|nr:carboxypeptidase-like regulatory domain-containing protein [Aequorivita lutea]
MKSIIFVLFLFSTLVLHAQIIGKVTDEQGQPLPYVNIYLQNSYIGTTTNDDGNYNLNISESKEYLITYQFLGFKTLTKKITPNSFPFILNVTLQEETTSLDEVVVSTAEDPAYRIIRKTIAQRKENLEKLSEYTADFYSRGLWKVQNVPEKIMGQEVGDFDGMLDSTRTGIIYLSETISEIAYQKPDNFTEKIIASKVSGNDNGFSFNSAQSANISFYENTISLNAALVSPIANNALSYYDYKLDGVFYEGPKLINKIKVIPKRPNDRVWQGYVYIVEDDWQLYGVELSTTGAAIQVPFVSNLMVKQNYKFDQKYNFWVKISQTVDFGFGAFGVTGDGRFIAVYSNYDFSPQFTKKTFTNEVLSFKAEANKKDSLYWRGSRPVPLTDEELKDYIKKDSIQLLRRSKPYLDSLDAKTNKPGILSPLTGYTYKNSFEKWSVGYEGPLPNLSFNTVQGYTSKAGFNFNKWYDDNQTNTLSAALRADYGLAEDRLRFTASVVRNFNWKDKLRITLKGGSTVAQFNDSEPISPLINTVSTLFFERNYMKLYELNFGEIGYSQEVFNGLHLYATVGYEDRKPLFNTTDYVTIPFDEVSYTSNNPLAPNDFNTAAIAEHAIVKSKMRARINFAQKYFSNPDMKFNIGDNKYPELNLIIENGAATRQSHYDYTQFEASVNQSISLGNKGQFYYNLKGGTFANGEGISFIDYKHFNGNQTRVGTSPNYTNVFNLMPYYEFSTNKSYFEGHLEHDFRGWILGKIPGINQLNLNLLAGAHFLGTEDRKPYSEVSVGIDNLGFGKFRLLRVDYVRSYYNGGSDGAFIFGLKFLDLLGL